MAENEKLNETARIACKALDEHWPVFINHNNETGKWCWAVELYVLPELSVYESAKRSKFWLNSFPTKKRALAFCKKHALPIKDIA